MKTYFTLIGRWHGTPWEIIFGDYDRDSVETERHDTEDYDRLKIIKTNHRQTAIDCAVATLNRRLQRNNRFLGTSE